ncbi:hypothetical protein HY988_02120 [Candidatus Micrarchaeota archaeon]|nr:hypothetical protein [Candidatus Micrarchaeota archaeon]
MRLIIALVVLILIFGCVEQKTIPGTASERITNIQSQDLEGDGNFSYAIYDFAPVQISGTTLTSQRELFAIANKQYAYAKVKENISDEDYNKLQKVFQDFERQRTAAEFECSKSLGLQGVVCIDAPTCSRLCSGSTPSCKEMANNYEEALGNSIRDYVQVDNEIKSVSTDLSILVQTIQNGEQSRQYLEKAQTLAKDIAELNANPIYSGNEFGLCSSSDFGVPSLLQGAKALGNYSLAGTTYHYRVIITLKSNGGTGSLGGSQQGAQEVLGLNLYDKIAKALDAKGISSKSEIKTTTEGNDVVVRWSTKKPSKNYMLIYEFDSSQDPEKIANSMKSPSVEISTINASFVGALLLALNNLVKNYYIALGLTIGLLMIFLLFVYAIATIVISIVGEKSRGGNASAGIRKALAKANSKWFGDFGIGILFLIIGFALSSFWVEQPTSPPGINEIPTFLLSNSTATVPVILALAGIVMLYMSLENFVKITVSQKMYGSVIRQEKDKFVSKAEALKEKINELKKLVETDRLDNFDVSREYDIVASVSVDKISEMAKSPNPRTNLMIEQEFARVENAIISLNERKKTADEKWPEWKVVLGKMLQERNEVFADSLLSIPSSLRLWALERYAKEGGEALTVERNVLKKKPLTPDKVLEEMIEAELIRGAVVLKNEKLFASKFADGSGTVVSALTLKLRSYAQSLARNIGEGNTSGFAAIGEKVVTLYIKGKNTEAVLFIVKDKYREAVEKWKLKSAVFEG